MTNRVTLVRTQVAYGVNAAEGAQITTARTQVLSRARVGTPKKASISTNVVFFNTVPSGGSGENSIHGFVAVATANQRWNSYRVSIVGSTPNDVYTHEYPPVLAETTAFPVGYSAGANFTSLTAQIAAANPSGRRVDQFTNMSGTTYTYDTIGAGPILGLGGVVGTTAAGMAWITMGNVSDFDYVPTATAPHSTMASNNSALWADPPPDGFPMVLRGFRLQRRMNEDISAVPADDSTRTITQSYTDTSGTVIRAKRGPGCPLVIRPGRGLYRVVKWNKGFVVRTDSGSPDLTPEFPGRTTDRFDEFVGRIFDGLDEFVRELLGRSYFVPGTVVDERDWGLRYPTSVLAVPAGPYIYKGWCSILEGPFVGELGWDNFQNRDVFDDGHYIATPRGNPVGAEQQLPVVRYRRLKTIRVWPVIAAPTPGGRSFGIGTSTTDASRERVEEMLWYPEGLPQPILKPVVMPEFWLEKLDSPSSNFLSTDPLVDP